MPHPNSNPNANLSPNPSPNLIHWQPHRVFNVSLCLNFRSTPLHAYTPSLLTRNPHLQVHWRFLGWMLTTIALVGLIIMREDHHKQLEAQGGRAQGGLGKRGTLTDDMDMLLVPIGIGLTMSIQNFFQSLLAPMETLGILYKSVFQMLANDVAKWLILFAIIFVNYGYFLAYTCYPSFNTLGFDPVPDFHSPLSAMWGLLQLAMLGEGFDVTRLSPHPSLPPQPQ